MHTVEAMFETYPKDLGEVDRSRLVAPSASAEAPAQDPNVADAGHPQPLSLCESGRGHPARGDRHDAGLARAVVRPQGRPYH